MIERPPLPPPRVKTPEGSQTRIIINRPWFYFLLPQRQNLSLNNTYAPYNSPLTNLSYSTPHIARLSMSQPYGGYLPPGQGYPPPPQPVSLLSRHHWDVLYPMPLVLTFSHRCNTNKDRHRPSKKRRAMAASIPGMFYDHRQQFEQADMSCHKYRRNVLLLDLRGNLRMLSRMPRLLLLGTPPSNGHNDAATWTKRKVEGALWRRWLVTGTYAGRLALLQRPIPMLLEPALS